LFDKICCISKLLPLVEAFRVFVEPNPSSSQVHLYLASFFRVALVSAPQTIRPIHQPGFCALQRCPLPCPGGKAKHLVDLA
jgi:hypothetical protein